jgi:hypothetical protein
MDAVTRMMNKGLEKIRTKFVELSQELDGTTDLSALREAPLNLPVEWPLASLDVLRGTEVTSHARYDAWHVECSKGPKRLRDPDYEPSEHDAGSSSDLSSDLNAHGKRPKMT